MTNNRRFGALILTHGRPDNVVTYSRLRQHGYTGPIRLVIDNEDKTEAKYRARYGTEVMQFDKAAIAKRFDTADNTSNRRSIVFARNASWDIAAQLGWTHFIQLDDDYTAFLYRLKGDGTRILATKGGAINIRTLGAVFDAMCDFIDATSFATIAMAQGGDMIGFASYQGDKRPAMFKRKAMNSFVCRTDRRFWFPGRINEDVNAYTCLASRGLLMGTTMAVTLNQKTTQQNAGGMTDIYCDLGTYVKSFYSVLMHPSSVRVASLHGRSHTRAHHKINWENTAPKILRENWRKV